MKFNNHWNLKDKHAFLSASKHAWLNYDIDKLRDTYKNHQAAMLGTELHEFASKCINLNQRLPRSKKTMNLFVNDALGFKMKSEQVLYYSDNCFGTADAISFRDNMLRIHDLKTGTSRVSMDQLIIYAALFCLEYDVYPEDIEMELRIYQTDEVQVYIPEWQEVRQAMDTIILFDKEIDKMKFADLN